MFVTIILVVNEVTIISVGKMSVKITITNTNHFGNHKVDVGKCSWKVKLDKQSASV